MKITVDCNNDAIHIESKTINTSFMRVKDPSKMCEILEEILNDLNPSGVELVKIDEDITKIVGEW